MASQEVEFIRKKDVRREYFVDNLHTNSPRGLNGSTLVLESSEEKIALNLQAFEQVTKRKKVTSKTLKLKFYGFILLQDCCQRLYRFHLTNLDDKISLMHEDVTEETHKIERVHQ